MQGKTWNCPFCKQQANPELAVFCASCGMPRGMEILDRQLDEDLTKIANDNPISLTNTISDTHDTINIAKPITSAQEIPEPTGSKKRAQDSQEDILEIFELIAPVPEESKLSKETDLNTHIQLPDFSSSLPNDLSFFEDKVPTTSLSNTTASKSLIYNSSSSANQSRQSVGTHTVSPALSQKVSQFFNYQPNTTYPESQPILHPAYRRSQQRQKFPVYLIIAVIACGISIVAFSLLPNFHLLKIPNLPQKLLATGHFFKPVSNHYLVTGHEWSRSGTIHSNKFIKNEGWQMPAGAELIRSFEVIDHYEKILDHYETKETTLRKQVGTIRVLKEPSRLNKDRSANIYETRPAYVDQVVTSQVPIYINKPVYKTKYLYKIGSEENKSFNIGGHDKNPYWPEIGPNAERKVDKEAYFLWVKDESGQNIRVPADFDSWRKINPGDSIDLKKDYHKLQIIK